MEEHGPRSLPQSFAITDKEVIIGTFSCTGSFSALLLSCTSHTLGHSFRPIAGRGRLIGQSPGNQRFQTLVEENLAEYSANGCKSFKSMIIQRVIQQVRSGCSPLSGGFVKYNKVEKHWYAIGDRHSKMITAQAFRDALASNYKSSKLSKRQKRHYRRLQGGNGGHCHLPDRRKKLENPKHLHELTKTTALLKAYPNTLQKGDTQNLSFCEDFLEDIQEIMDMTSDLDFVWDVEREELSLESLPLESLQPDKIIGSAHPMSMFRPGNLESEECTSLRFMAAKDDFKGLRGYVPTTDFIDDSSKDSSSGHPRDALDHHFFSGNEPLSLSLLDAVATGLFD